MSNYTLEICAGTLNSALIAQANGADRVELCDNLAEGGTTPSAGMISQCKKLLHIPFFPIIRPRGGDFVYSQDEFEVMKEDVILCRKLKCDGVVIGMLKRDGSIDTERCSELISLAGSMQITFHRAFDRCKDMEVGLEHIIQLGCRRILTSGGKVHAIDALDKLKSLVEQAGSRISIMPGSGITNFNLNEILRETGAHEFHTTAKTHLAAIPDTIYPNGMDPCAYYETDPENVMLLKEVLQGA